jgi:hypothetical protein
MANLAHRPMSVISDVILLGVKLKEAILSNPNSKFVLISCIVQEIIEEDDAHVLFRSQVKKALFVRPAHARKVIDFTRRLAGGNREVQEHLRLRLRLKL